VTAERQRILRKRLPWAAVLLVGCCAICRADEPCARCHPEEVVAFERSPMGSSLGSPSVFVEGRLIHRLSGSTLTIQRRESRPAKPITRPSGKWLTDGA
jgi:hypothetical protein